MPKTIRNKFDEKLTYENLMQAHIKSRKGKGYRKEIILFNLKQEEYIKWLEEQLRTQRYKHGKYQVFYIKEPKERKIEKSRYIFPVLRERKSRKSFAIKSIPFFAISFSKSAAITLAAKKPGAIYCPILFFPKNKEHAKTTVDPMAIIM